MVVDFTSKDTVEKAVKRYIENMSEEEKSELIQQAREDDIFDLQIKRSDEEMLHIAVKYQIYEEQT